MNQKLFEKQLIELVIYFEKHQNNKMTLTKREHTDIINGILFLLLKCSEEIDFTEYLSKYPAVKAKSREGMQTVLETLMNQVTTDEKVNYIDIAELLRICIHCFSNPMKMDINGEEWLKLSSDFRILEMERLSIQ